MSGAAWCGFERGSGDSHRSIPLICSDTVRYTQEYKHTDHMLCHVRKYSVEEYQEPEQTRQDHIVLLFIITVLSILH